MVETQVTIIGAGPAGLATAACLQQLGIPYVILEKEGQVAAAWHRHYDRLHLHTEKKYSQLPYKSFPASYPKYVSRLQLIEYFDNYAKEFEIQPRFEETVQTAMRVDMKWRVKTNKEEYWSRFLVMACGLSHTPRIPKWPGQETFTGKILHSSQYKNGAAFKEKSVLVVGFGNSGGEITIDLHEHGAKPSLSVRGPVNIVPKEIAGINSIALSLKTQFIPNAIFDKLSKPIVRMKQGDLGKIGLRKSKMGPREQVQKTGKIPLIDLGTLQLLKEGTVTAYPGIREIHSNGVTFVDNRRVDFEAIVLATGYTPDCSFLIGGEHYFTGKPQENIPQIAGERPGLFFVGLRNFPTGALRGMGEDAKAIAQMIADAPPPPVFPEPVRPPNYSDVQ